MAAKISSRATTTGTPGGDCFMPSMCSTSTIPATTATAARSGLAPCARTWIFEAGVRLLSRPGRLGLGLLLGLQLNNHFIRLGVVQLLPRHLADGVRAGVEPLIAITQTGILLLQAVDILAQLPVLGALLLPNQQAVLARSA